MCLKPQRISGLLAMQLIKYDLVAQVVHADSQGCCYNCNGPNLGSRRLKFLAKIPQETTSCQFLARS